MVEWLEMDLTSGEEPNNQHVLREIEEKNEIEEEMTFEVVDAAALLASQDDPKSSRISVTPENVAVENLNVHSGSILVEANSAQEVQVVDAAKLFASANSQDEVEVKTEVIVAPVSVVKSSAIVAAQADEGQFSLQELVRLMASKNGRLLKEISIHDLVRLCEAAVLNHVDGHGRELIVGLFARQVVSLLNDALANGENKSSAIVLADITSSEAATLIWVLGELGVKVSPPEDSSQSNRKMKIDTLEPIVSKIKVELIDSTRLHRLIRGLVLMKQDLSHQSLLVRALNRKRDILSESVSAKFLCIYAEDVGMIRESPNGRRKTKPTDSETKPPEIKGGSDDADDDDDKLQESEAKDRKKFDDEDLLASTEELLNSIANEACSMSKSLTAAEIRRLLEVYSLLPYQADEMIRALEAEVSLRLATLEELSMNQTLGLLLKNADEKASVVKATLYEESDKSFFDSMKNGFMSLFGTNSEDKTAESTEESKDVLTEQIASMIQESIAAISAASHNAQVEESALQVQVDAVLASLREEASFELGRAAELLENYHRIEFSTGKRTSRYDVDRRKAIAKRVLSRLIP
ncbi:MAG: hypothetical protein SGILL_009069 [Bacillariaceae sp.]